MCLNSGEMITDNFFQKKFRREKWQRGKNDRGYYGDSISSKIINTSTIWVDKFHYKIFIKIVIKIFALSNK